MKYSGSIMILNEDAEVVYERDLSADELIEALLYAPEVEELTEAPPAPVKQPNAGKKACGNCGEVGHTRPTCTKAEKVTVDGDARPCCGSKPRGRHKAGCTESTGTIDPRRKRTIPGRTPFSEPTYNVVKTLLGEASVDAISAEKGLDLDEVRRINLSDDYDDYLSIA